MRSLQPWQALAGLAAAIAAGCATPDAPLSAHLASPSPLVRDCAHWYARLDAEIDEAGVRDAQEARVAGFPYLRVNRVLAALRERAARDDAAMDAWVERLLELDAEARRHEIVNLPRARFDRLPDMQGKVRPVAWGHTHDCARLLRDTDFAHAERRALLLERAQVPDDYSIAMRALGLYPLTRLPFARGVRAWQDEMREAFRRSGEAGEGPPRVRYAPPPAGPSGSLSLAHAARDRLGLPALAEREREILSAAHAPSIEIAIESDADRFGALRWGRDGAMPEVDFAEPAVYFDIAYTRYGGQLLVQLVYTLWFSERPAERDGDPLAGRLDGLVWRVTLAPDGEPLVFDSIHPCGCYHMFFPTPRARARPAPDALEEWAFVPQVLPRPGAGERARLRLSSRTHQLENVTFVRGVDSLVGYALRPYGTLRSLPRADAGSRGVFGADGLIAGSERTERYTFWPMGIESAGAMRQWGRQATAFVGRRHFDDADLFERRFVFDLGEAAQGVVQ